MNLDVVARRVQRCRGHGAMWRPTHPKEKNLAFSEARDRSAGSKLVGTKVLRTVFGYAWPCQFVLNGDGDEGSDTTRVYRSLRLSKASAERVNTLPFCVILLLVGLVERLLQVGATSSL